jgi:type II secretory pathway pseudopilin PulG
MSAVESRARGVTLTEMLAVVAIMMILSTMAVGGFMQRVHLARVKRAMAETRQIAEAEEACAAIHGFFVPLQVLDDVMDIVGMTGNTFDDTINNEPYTSIYLIDPNIPVINQQTNQLRLSNTLNQRVLRIRTNWNGPFLKTKDVYIGDAETDDPEDVANSSTEIFYDFPLDPWGQPYRFYSPIGVIGSNALNEQPSGWGSGFGDGRLTTLDDRFDRFVIVSFGPDGSSDNVSSDGNDDIMYFFGSTSSETTYNRF